MEKSVADEVAQVSTGRPHVVLLGAGASRAAFPNGERNGRLLPLMLDFADIVPVADIFAEAGIPLRTRNFEDAYAELALAADKASLRDAVERAVFDYFASLEIPNTPTLYDHLVLSLRPKDVIATFNWDPFLIQAVTRNGHVGGYPRLLFLHGNVLQGYCETDNLHGRRGARCSRCGQGLKSVRLLYPVQEKDYEADRAISSAWNAVKAAFANTFMVTIFGYSAPQSDRGAVDLLRAAWGGSQERSLEQFEVIDIKDEVPPVESWSEFIHTHHYEIHTDFYESWIANHPRRTGEAYWNQYMEAAFIDDHPVARPNRLEELWRWFAPLVAAERAVDESRNAPSS